MIPLRSPQSCSRWFCHRLSMAATSWSSAGFGPWLRRRLAVMSTMSAAGCRPELGRPGSTAYSHTALLPMSRYSWESSPTV
eukprot:CAMPEP_0204288500 /NCGR_PEP_ID=MMETSP0468-20130131/56883_1 /ASSEMBLY_ACC=CAM_ASM_000383 /TAXON_ID=2969 /ORGANISM="Oxyrrhis marina" /LENGTH=80 /DNA_ID=CAMNT_0051266599 /DNA_START=112 /DNA_END=351 /DNA_ORIENTATION=-